MLKVLLVDDEPFIVQGLSALIDWEKEGFEIVGTAGNGSEAVEFLKSNPVDLILADIKMPVMNGLEFLKYIRETHLSEAFFVILSGYGDFTYAKEAIKMAVYGLHIKADPEKPAPCTAFKGKTDAAG